jgi:hypothetical protein
LGIGSDAKFQQAVAAATVANAVLTVQDRTGALALDRNRNDRHQRQSKRNERTSDNQIARSP